MSYGSVLGDLQLPSEGVSSTGGGVRSRHSMTNMTNAQTGAWARSWRFVSGGFSTSLNDGADITTARQKLYESSARTELNFKTRRFVVLS
jgi:hypothetical protein